MTESLIGNLLVASSTVEEPVFTRAVCLVVHQDENGAIGVMLNRPLQPLPGGLTKMLGHDSTEGTNRLTSDEATLADATAAMGTVHFGGPQSGPVVAVHGSSEHAEAETGAGIYVAAQKDHLEELVRNKPCPYRLIVGHVGWDNERLLAELSAGMWHVIPATTDSVFAADSDMWPQVVRRATASSVANWIGTPDVPDAWRLN